jgi:hypothetical protein
MPEQPDQPDQPEPAAVDAEGDDQDHGVPADLVEIHEAIEWTEAAAKGPNP